MGIYTFGKEREEEVRAYEEVRKLRGDDGRRQLFCPECGMKQEEQPPYGQEQPPYGQEDWKPYKKKGGGVVVVCVFLLISSF